MGNEQFKRLQKVSCLCGTQVKVDTSSNDRHVTCPSCNNEFDVVVSMDAARKRSQISIVLSRAAMKTEGESLGKASGDPAPSSAPLRGGATEGKPARAAAPTPPPPAPKTRTSPPRSGASEVKPKVSRVARKVGGKTTKAIMGNCECGASFPLEETGELTSMQSCPQCNRSYHVVFKLESGTHEKTAMMVPDKISLPKSRTIAPKPSTPDPNDLRVTDFFTPSHKSRTRVGGTKARSKAKPPPEIPPGAQGVPCPCGTVFVVRRRDLGGELTCEGCGKTASFEEVRDPQTLAPVIRVRK
jgi:hypothetical protein